MSVDFRIQTLNPGIALLARVGPWASFRPSCASVSSSVSRDSSTNVYFIELLWVSSRWNRAWQLVSSSYCYSHQSFMSWHLANKYSLHTGSLCHYGLGMHLRTFRNCKFLRPFHLTVRRNQRRSFFLLYKPAREEGLFWWFFCTCWGIRNIFELFRRKSVALCCSLMSFLAQCIPRDTYETRWLFQAFLCLW